MNIEKLSRVQDGTASTATGKEKGNEEVRKLKDMFLGLAKFKESSKGNRINDKLVREELESLNKVKDELQLELSETKNDVLELMSKLQKVRDSKIEYIKKSKRQAKSLGLKIADANKKISDLHQELKEERAKKESSEKEFFEFKELFSRKEKENSQNVKELLDTIEQLKNEFGNAGTLVFNYNPETESFSSEGSDSCTADFEEVGHTVKTLSSLFPEKKIVLNIGEERTEISGVDSLKEKIKKDSVEDDNDKTVEFAKALELYLNGTESIDTLLSYKNRLSPVLEKLLSLVENGAGFINEEAYFEIKEDLQEEFEEHKVTVPSLPLIMDSQNDPSKMLAILNIPEKESEQVIQSIPGTPGRFRIADSASREFVSIKLSTGQYLLCD